MRTAIFALSILMAGCGQDSASSSNETTQTTVPDLTGYWGRDWFLLEPPPSGSGPVANINRNADGALDVLGGFVGDYTNPILKPEAAEVVRRQGELQLSGSVPADYGNQCRPMPPPFVVANDIAVQILQQSDKVIILYVEDHKVRQIPLNVPHPPNLTPSWQGHSVGRYEGDTLVIDTIGIRVVPFSAVDAFGTPHTEALHVIERYRLIDGDVAAAAHQKILEDNDLDDLNEATLPFEFIAPFYGRGPLDPDTTKMGLQVEITVEDPGVFTTPWSGLVTYRPVTGDFFPEVVCAEAPRMFGTDVVIPTAETPDF